LEILEEFRLYHNLSEDQSSQRFWKVLEDGSEQEVIRFSSNKVEIRTVELKQFLAIKGASLLIFFDIRTHYEQPLKDLELEEGIQGTETVEDVTYTHTAGSGMTRERSFERIVGQKLIRGFTREHSGTWPYSESVKAKEHYASFIVAVDKQGKNVTETCDARKNNYLTAVFFKSEVLNKYYENTSKYSVRDGYLGCGSLWGVAIDNDHEEHVSVFLGDLGRDLPENERSYWRSFNVPPPGGISETAFRRSFLAEFAAPSRSDLRFKDALYKLNERWIKNYDWQLFKALTKDDAHCLNSLRVPATSEQREFDSQIMNLTKILVDSINEKEIGKLIKFDQPEKGISKIQKMAELYGKNFTEDQMAVLRDLQTLRSSAAAHRKGDSYMKVAGKLRLKDLGTKAVFVELLEKSIALLSFLSTVELPGAPSSRQSHRR